MQFNKFVNEIGLNEHEINIIIYTSIDFDWLTNMIVIHS